MLGGKRGGIGTRKIMGYPRRSSVALQSVQEAMRGQAVEVEVVDLA
jgi:hypothetical protein